MSGMREPSLHKGPPYSKLVQGCRVVFHGHLEGREVVHFTYRKTEVQRGSLTQSYSSSEWKNQDLKAGLSFSQETHTGLEYFIDKETEAQREVKTCLGSEERVNPGVVTLLGSLLVICQNLPFIQFALIFFYCFLCLQIQ